MNDNLRTFCDFLGMGDPNSKIWFVGLEEGGNAIVRISIDKMKKSCKEYPYYFRIKAGDKISPVWNYMSKIVLQYETDNFINWKLYREMMFCKGYSKFFSTELFPLPKNSYNNWGKDYKYLFGFSEDEIDDYKSEVASYRYPKIKKLWDETNPIITICYGKNAWNYFEMLFQLSNCDSELINTFKIFPEHKIIFSPFFGRWHFYNNKVNELVEIIKNKFV